VLLQDHEIAALMERFGVTDQRTRGVLLVDDEQFNVKVLRGFLEDAWNVYEASSGAEALAMTSALPLDVVVADHRMPGMTGVELLEELRRREPELAGIVLTGYMDMEALESAINRAHVYRFLRKPWEPSDIVQAIEQASSCAGQRRTIAKLVTLLAERTGELSASLARLETQQRMLIELERLGTIGQLAAGVTHDLRNVMVALREAECEVVESEVVSASVRETMTAGVRGVDNLLASLQGLHDYVRHGAVALQLHAFEPAEVMKDALAIARMDLLYRLRRVECDVPRDLPRLTGDRQKLTQVLVNLVRNALHATRERGAVRIGAVARGGAELEFAVEDEGPGVPHELRDRLFQPFASTKGAQGLGMGLYMARLIVEAHGGRIAVVNGPSGGARFEVVLPVVHPVGELVRPR
jgi:signal transduction histidine kinase